MARNRCELTFKAVPTIILESAIMKQINFSQLQSELKANGIPEFCKKLKSQNGYNAVARKQRLNPTEQRIIDASGRDRSSGYTAKA
jgi:hypothetical protein